MRKMGLLLSVLGVAVALCLLLATVNCGEKKEETPTKPPSEPAGQAPQTKEVEHEHGEHEHGMYVCPMGCEKDASGQPVEYDKPGQCPICKGELKLKVAAPAEVETPEQPQMETYVCPMGDDKDASGQPVEYDKPGTCPTCNATLVPKVAVPAEVETPEQPKMETYVCPMGCEKDANDQPVEYDKPGQCPICKGELKLKETPATTP